MASDSDSSKDLEENYYAFLNVPKTATAEQINSSYRYLSRIYHPDKHQDMGNKKDAEIMFNRTKRAYEVLSDPQKRAIYDSVGVKGLRTSGWEVVQRMKTPAEIREEYQRLAQAAEERKLQQRTNPKGTFMVNINATEIFSPYDESDIPRIEIRSMSLSQSIETPISQRDMVILNGNLYTSNGNGSGALMVTGRRLVNKGYIEAEIGAGNGVIMGLKGQRTLHPKLTLTGGTNFSYMNNSLIPLAFANFAVQLEKFTVGTLVCNVGVQNSLTTRIDRNTERHGWSTALTIGMPDIYLTVAYTHKMLEREMKVRLAAKVGTFGFLGEYGIEKKVSKYSSLNATVSIGVPTGVILKLKMTRSNHNYVLPIHLSDEIIPASVFYATLTPILGWLVIKKTILDPMAEERKKLEIERNKKHNEERIAEKRKEAEAAINVLQNTYQRILTTELQRSGLIITKATYGVLNNDGMTFKPNESIDVTLQTQCLVKDSKLYLYNSEKCDLPGFYDPSIGEDKVLRIEYTYNQETKTITVRDTESVLLPR